MSLVLVGIKICYCRLNRCNKYSKFSAASNFLHLTKRNSICCGNVVLKCVNSQARNFQSSPQSHLFNYVPKQRIKTVISHSSLLEDLQKCASVEEQVEVFNSSVKLQEDDVAERRNICIHLEDILKSTYPECSVYPVGSSINGLGIKGCDLDLSFQHSSSYDDQVTKTADKSFPTYKEVSSGKIPASEVTLLPASYQLRFISHLLENSGVVENVAYIPGRCPILNFQYKHINCDLSFDNKSALQGTNLTSICEKLDPRVGVLARIITYWAKQCKLIGGPMKFKSYALFLLLVYFLQTRRPYILPSMEEVFCNTEFMENFSNSSYFRSSQNNQNIVDLLREFFFFYMNFDFTEVICPTHSSCVDRSSFLINCKPENNFEINTINIQDPLDSSWNVTTGVNWKYCKAFLKEVLAVCRLYHTEGVWLPKCADKWGLASVFSTRYDPASIDRQEFVIDIPIPLHIENTEKALTASSNAVFEALNYGLNFQCKLVNSSQNETPQKSSEHLISRIFCAVNDSWRGRNNFYANLDKIPDLCVEHAISEKILLERSQKQKDGFSFTCDCKGILRANNVLFSLTLKSTHRARFIPKLEIVLKEYIPKCVIMSWQQSKIS